MTFYFIALNYSFSPVIEKLLTTIRAMSFILTDVLGGFRSPSYSTFSVHVLAAFFGNAVFHFSSSAADSKVFGSLLFRYSSALVANSSQSPRKG